MIGLAEVLLTYGAEVVTVTSDVTEEWTVWLTVVYEEVVAPVSVPVGAEVDVVATADEEEPDAPFPLEMPQ